VKVANLNRAIELYCGVLGFDVMQRYGDEAAFLSADNYHHPSLSEIKYERSDDAGRRGRALLRCSEGVNWSPRRRILVQGQACSAPIVVARITAQQMEKVALSQDNHVIQTVPSDRTDRPFAITFCQGERAAVGRSRMPIARIRLIKASPYA